MERLQEKPLVLNFTGQPETDNYQLIFYYNCFAASEIIRVNVKER
jgi:hypothetical protein